METGLTLYPTLRFSQTKIFYHKIPKSIIQSISYFDYKLDLRNSQ